jgi:hypothetical protein
MAKTVTIKGSRNLHLSVSDRHKSPLCGATHNWVAETKRSDRQHTSGEVTCPDCKQVLQKAVKNVLA